MADGVLLGVLVVLGVLGVVGVVLGPFAVVIGICDAQLLFLSGLCYSSYYWYRYRSGGCM